MRITETWWDSLSYCARHCKTRTNMRQRIPAKVKLAATLKFLSTGSSYADLQYHFGIHDSRLSKFVHHSDDVKARARKIFYSITVQFINNLKKSYSTIWWWLSTKSDRVRGPSKFEFFSMVLTCSLEQLLCVSVCIIQCIHTEAGTFSDGFNWVIRRRLQGGK